MGKVILHVDMDAFFAAVEQQCNPKIRKKPIGVVGSSERTVVATSSYEARSRGVKTGMTKHEARRACPEIHFVEGNNPKYIDTSVRLVSILKSFTPLVELASIDEAFLDVTGSMALFGDPISIVQEIKRRVKEEFGSHVTCSIGIAPNKLLAKLASRKNKPNGFFQIRPEEVDTFLRDLAVGKMYGIGPKLEKHLNRIQIRTCGELGRFPVSVLKSCFGVLGEILHSVGLGIDSSPVIPIGEGCFARSMGHTLTLRKDETDAEAIRLNLLYLSELVSRRARKSNYCGRTVVVMIRYSDFHTFTRRETLGRYIISTRDIYDTACQIVERVFLKKPVRLLGVGISNLVRGCFQLPLFPSEERGFRVSETMDLINDRFGDFSLTWGTLAGWDRRSGSIPEVSGKEGNRVG